MFQKRSQIDIIIVGKIHLTFRWRGLVVGHSNGLKAQREGKETDEAAQDTGHGKNQPPRSAPGFVAIAAL